jgi:nucleotide-binding universal stress UspA family protein
MREDRAYLERTALEMRERHGSACPSVLALGDPPRENPALSEESQCDLIAMTTHGPSPDRRHPVRVDDRLRPPPLQDPRS